MKKSQGMFAFFTTFLLLFTSLMSGSTMVLANEGQDATEKSDYDSNDSVRIIVEVEGESAVDYASKQGTLYNQLSPSKKTELENIAEQKINEVKDELQSHSVSIDVKEKFTTVVNGFSGEVKYKDLDKMKNLPNIENVYISNKIERPLPKPDMETAHNFIQSPQTWGDADYRGEGTIISIIDSGVDPYHKDFTISNSTDVALTEDDTEKIVQEENLPGKYYNEKVPYGYNYYDQNDTILDLGPNASEHGMHVAGIAAANGEIEGVAPEAQILGMKVFGNDPEFPSTWEDIYLKAIDDSIKLGADVINMSLGSPAAFFDEESMVNKAITKSVDNGVVVSVSSGNSGYYGYGTGLPLAENPDLGVVGSPGLSKNSLQVAATGNYRYLVETDIQVDDITATGYGADDWEEKLDKKQLPLATIGGKVGTKEDFRGVDVEGKVVLVQRGEIPFITKTENAMDAGAKGIIVYNNNPESTFYKNQGHWDMIPFMMVKKDVGEKVEQAIADGTDTISFETSKKEEGPEVGKPTDFSSWGTTPSLELKPEITAPGGGIYSTLQDDEYGYKSGTSMSAPQVAGGSALVTQFLKEEYPALSVEERAALVKVRLMNSSDIIENEDGHPFSPRQQGAGMMQTYAAVTTPVTVTDADTNEAKVELFDFTKDSISFTLEAKNHTGEELTYDVTTDVLSDTIVDGRNQLVGGELEGADVSGLGKVTIPANGTEEVTITIDLSDAELAGDSGELIDNFIEGFVQFEHPTEPNLSVPYVGFYGEWDRPAIFDGIAALDETSYYQTAGMVDAKEENLVPNEEGQYAISPNGDGKNDVIMPAPTLLRNAAVLKSNLLNEDKEHLRTIYVERELPKNYLNGGVGEPVTINEERAWAGKNNFKLVDDGLYYYELQAKIDYENADWQYDRVPVIVDTVAPELDVTLDEENHVVSWDTTEDGSGIKSYELSFNDNVVTLEGDKDSYELPEDEQIDFVRLKATDYAMNATEELEIGSDNTIPYVSVTSPEGLKEFGSKTVEIQGVVTEPAILEELTVNGETIEVEEDPATGEYDFTHQYTFDRDGANTLTFKATDISGNTISFKRTILVDSTPADISLEETAPRYVVNDEESYSFDVTVEDNFEQIDFYQGDDFVYGNSFDIPLEMRSHTKTLTRTVELEEGENTIRFMAKDLGGNVTEKEFHIYRLSDNEGIPEFDPNDGDFEAPQGLINVWNPMNNVAADKTFTVSFNKAMMKDTVNKETMKVFNEDGKQTEVTITPSEDGKSVTVTPDNGWNAQSTYQLWVLDGVTDQSGKPLKDPIKFEFTTK